MIPVPTCDLAEIRSRISVICPTVGAYIPMLPVFGIIRTPSTL